MGVAAVALIACLGMGLLGGAAADAKQHKKHGKHKKKNKKKHKKEQMTPQVSVPSYTAQAGPVAVPASSSTVYGLAELKFSVAGPQINGAKVGAVSVTVQTSGSAPGAASQIEARLISPTGRTTYLEGGLGGTGAGGLTSIGPLTLTADSPVLTCDQANPPCTDPFATLNRPFAGTAGNAGLEIFEGRPMAGIWTVAFIDRSQSLTSSASAILTIAPGA